MIVLPVYLFLGILLAFGVWIARQDEKLEVFEVIALVIIWPYFFLYIFFLSDIKLVIKQATGNKFLFTKVFVALLAVAGIVILIAEKLGR